MRILTLFLRYGTEKYRESEDELDSFLTRSLPNVSCSRLVIDNALPQGFQETTSATRRVIGGDNSFWEFSGWERALRFLGSEIDQYDFIHLATSAFNTNYTSYLSRFTEEALRFAQGKPIALGHIDCYNQPVRLLSYTFQHWLRSCYIFLPPLELKLLSSLTPMREQRQIFSSPEHFLATENPFQANAPLSNDYQRNILNWLTGQGTGQGTTWHSRFDLTEQMFPFFCQKASAIFHEHLLSARLRAQGCILLDITWLATKLQQKIPALDIQIATPWHQQLKERDTDALQIY